MNPAAETSPRGPLATALTWLCRLLVGAAFIVGGWAKSIDPYGTVYKMLEYVHAWGLHSMPHEPVVMAAVVLGATELTIGICVLFGVLRHSSAVAASAVMCFMLPLTVYIAVANPVSDCGCFGDLLIISNTATLVKNIVIAACCVWLLLRNNCCNGVFLRPVQWIVVTATVIYALVLAAVGYNVQPVVDFRPYPTGSAMCMQDSDDTIRLIYSKDGREAVFASDELPDSTWTFVGVDEETYVADEAAFPVFDEDGMETEVFQPEGSQLIFVVPDPGDHFLTRSRFANELADYASSMGVETAAIVGTGSAGLREWSLLTAPVFDVYSADDTDLKTLVRGDIAAVYLRDGSIVWKRNLASLDNDFVEKATSGVNALDTLDVPDDGTLAAVISGSYLAVLGVLAIATAAVRLIRRRKASNTCSPHK